MTVYCQIEKLKDNCLEYPKKETQENYPSILSKVFVFFFFWLKTNRLYFGICVWNDSDICAGPGRKKKEISHTWVSPKDF